ncbi:uncharacterized protein LOC132295308, partial [Cornus florida]|uniref:uncharacterized protein LOC132295308 n=1 Tax=Cornus florida TaxID=4283 RepID=UPI00289AEB7F
PTTHNCIKASNISKKSSTASLRRLPPPLLSSPSGGSVSASPPKPPSVSASPLTLSHSPLSSSLSHYPYLSLLSLTAAAGDDASALFDHLLLSVASSCPNSNTSASSVSFFSLLSLSVSCPNLTSLNISLSRPLSFHWITSFLSLKDLTVFFTGNELNSDEFDSQEEHSQIQLFTAIGVSRIGFGGAARRLRGCNYGAVKQRGLASIHKYKQVVICKNLI